jgi:hypothetical protein
VRKVTRSAAVGVLYPPRAAAVAPTEPPGPFSTSGVSPRAVEPKAAATSAADVSKVRLAGEALHDRPLDEVAREVATAWRRLHPAPTPSDPKK